MDKSVTRSSVTITLNYIDTYMDYAIANITAINNTSNTICLDTKENTKTLYMYDENDVTYTSFLNEIADIQLCLAQGEKRSLDIKFNKIYNEREISGICFSDIVLNYEAYEEGTESKNKVSIDTGI